MERYGLKKNNEGYADPTAYEAIKGIVKPGEVWTLGEKELLIIKNQGSFCNALALLDERKSMDDIKVETSTGEIKYTHPGMLQYIFTDRLGRFVSRMSGTGFDKVISAVESALQIQITIQCTEEKKEAREPIDASLQLEMYKNLYWELVDKMLQRMDDR